jgi:hypothetical protein
MAQSLTYQQSGRLSPRDHATALGIFALLSLIYLKAYVLNPNGFNGTGDDAVFANAFWWFKRSLIELKNPFFSDFLFFPDGMSIVFHTTTYSNFILTLPVNLLLGVNAAVNASYFLSFILCGYFAFLLVYDLTSSKAAAIVAGLIFSFSPFHFAHGRSHLHMATLQWLPLYFLMLKRALENRRVVNALFAGVALGLVVLTDQLQTICAVLASGMIITIAFIATEKNVGKLQAAARQLGIMAITAFVCSSFYLLPALREIFNHRSATKIGVLERGGANMFSADLLGFVLPGFHRWWGSLFSSFNLGRDSVVYIGFVALFLAVYGGWKCRDDMVVRCAGLVALCFWVMSLGTYLHLNGSWVFADMRIPLPYLAMTDIPLIGENRTPGRFHLMTILAVAILSGYGFRELIKRYGHVSNRGGLFVLAALPLLILVETLPPAQDPGSTQVPRVFYEMAHDREAYSVLQLPLSRWSAIYRNGSGNPATMMYYQTIHEKPIFGGLASRLPPEDLDFRDQILNVLVETSAYDNGLLGQKMQPSAIDIDYFRQAGRMFSIQRESFLKKYGIRYIMLHSPLTGNTVSRAFLESFMGREFSVDAGVVYLKVY